MKPFFIGLAVAVAGAASFATPALAQNPAAPVPIAEGKAQDWLFVFKLNAKRFPTPETDDKRLCPFGGGKPKPGAVGLSYAYATSSKPTLRLGTGLAGKADDPLGATFAEIWNGNYNYVVWNDQFYQYPLLECARAKSPKAKNADGCDAPWGHSKGVLAWNNAGEGMILQVTTPNWPGAAAKDKPRDAAAGNTLGCIATNDNVIVSQHFFALKLSESDVEHVLDALVNASVVTDPNEPTLVRNGGPPAIRAKVTQLGRKVPSTTVLDFTLSSGVRLISKPSKLIAAPWQLISSLLADPPASGAAAAQGINLRTGTWWGPPVKIPTTTANTDVPCRAAALPPPGAVEIATSGFWQTTPIGLEGKVGDGNHAKIGVSTSGTRPLTIFGDMNQQGRLTAPCDSAQNKRGGLFFVVENPGLHDSVQNLLKGCTAPQLLAKDATTTRCVPPK